MSWQATAWADGLAYDVCGPLAFRVLIKLANVADPQGKRAWRAKSVMASELGVSQRSIQRALKELEAAALILLGDQSFVHAERADKRPTVYDVNMRWQPQYEQLELPNFDPESGETQLSTGASGETTGVASGETTGVAQGTIYLTNNSSTKGNPSTGAGENKDASGDSSTAAIAIIHQCCPLDPRRREHDFATGTCPRCGIRSTDRWQRGEIAPLDELLATLGANA